MRGATRILTLALAAVFAAAALLYLLRAPIAGWFLRGAAERAGLEDARFRVKALSFDRLSLAGIAAGKEGDDVRLDRLDATFDLGRLLNEKIVDRVSLGSGAIEIVLADDGSIRVSNLKIGGAAGAQQGLTVGAVAAEDLAYRVSGPQGEVEGSLSGALDFEHGGKLELSARTGELSLYGVTLSDWSNQSALTFNDDGRAQIKSKGGGHLSSGAAALKGLKVEISAAGQSWRRLMAGDRAALYGDAHVAFSSGLSPASGNPLFASLFAFRASPPDTIKASGVIDLAAKDGVLTVDFGEEGALKVESDRGEELLISAKPGADAAFRSTGKRQTLALKAGVAGDDLGGEAELAAERDGVAAWTFDTSGRIGGEVLRNWNLGETDFAAKGLADGKSARADLKLDAMVRSATIGRLTISDAPFAGDFAVEADFPARTLRVSSDPNGCLRMARGRFTLAGQNSETNLKEARLCRGDGPLLVWRGGDHPQADVKGRLVAKTGSYRLGATTIDGLPPAADLVARYDPKAQFTEVSGTLADGVVVINRAMVMTDARGTFTGSLDKAALAGDVKLSRATLTQNVKAPQLAPVIVTGEARLALEKVDFTYSAATESGRPIGKGEGFHDVRRGVGRTVYKSGALAFAPGKLQPDEIVGALKGIVSNATGSASGDATFVWGRRPSDFRSSGNLALAKLAFAGPGRAVNRTSGVSGKIALASLSPLKSEGEQTISVGAVDMDALQLENGAIRYSLPGDGTMRIAEATFPWFGGRIGAYESTAALTGAEITTALKADDVDLKQLLEYVKIEGLSGEGVIEGSLPLKIASGRARIVDGFFSAKGPGVIRYVGKAGEAAGSTNAQAKFAFDILRNLHFDELTAKIDGPLDGDLNFNIVFKGANQVTVDERQVTSPVVYRISLEAPLLALIDQARISSDIKLQIERAGGTIEEQ